MNSIGVHLLTFLFSVMAVTTRSSAAEEDLAPEEEGQQVAVQPSPQEQEPQPQQSGRNNGEGSTSTQRAQRGGLQPHNVKMPVKAKDDGSNLGMWKKALVAACLTKGCLIALEEPMPGEPEDMAAMLLILSSVPEEWYYNLSIIETAHQAFLWIMDQYTGGHNLQATKRWRAELERGMQPGETLTVYVRRMINLKNCLRSNMHDMLDEEIIEYIIKGLPQEAKDSGMFSSAGALPLDKILSLVLTTARGVGFDSLAPWQPTVPAANAIPPSPTIAGGTTGATPTEGGAAPGGRPGRGRGGGAERGTAGEGTWGTSTERYVNHDLQQMPTNGPLLENM
jgi:hypothetical protein